jgi:hypothetical protein
LRFDSIQFQFHSISSHLISCRVDRWVKVSQAKQSRAGRKDHQITDQLIEISFWRSCHSLRTQPNPSFHPVFLCSLLAALPFFFSWLWSLVFVTEGVELVISYLTNENPFLPYATSIAGLREVRVLQSPREGGPSSRRPHLKTPDLKCPTRMCIYTVHIYIHRYE